MDEPTNDLDIETLELLEEILVNYAGTLILVSHDRTFLNNVVTSTIVLEGDGVAYEHPGGYDDWVLRRKDIDRQAVPLKPKAVVASATPAVKPTAGSESDAPILPTKPKKLSHKEQKELDGLPALIEKFDAEQAAIVAEMADPKFFQKDPKTIAETTARLDTINRESARAFSRWEELERVRSSAAPGAN